MSLAARSIDVDLTEFVTVHGGTAETIGDTWDQRIDLVFPDGDQSIKGARSAFEIWEPWLKTGGILVIGSSTQRTLESDHDGHFRIRIEQVIEPAYRNIRELETTTFAEKC